MDPEDQLRCHAARHELLQVRKQHGQGETRSRRTMQLLQPLNHVRTQCNIALNRKVLSELAIHEPKTFKVLPITPGCAEVKPFSYLHPCLQALADIAKRRQNSHVWKTLDIDRIKDGESELYQPRLVHTPEGRTVTETDV